MLNKLKSLWNKLPDSVKRIWHTAWVAYAVVFGGGLLPIIHTFLQNNNLSGAFTAVGALAIAALVAAGTAVRVALVKLGEKYLEQKD